MEGGLPDVGNGIPFGYILNIQVLAPLVAMSAIGRISLHLLPGHQSCNNLLSSSHLCPFLWLEISSTT